MNSIAKIKSFSSIGLLFKTANRFSSVTPEELKNAEKYVS